MPDGFAFPVNHRYWVPLTSEQAIRRRTGTGSVAFSSPAGSRRASISMPPTPSSPRSASAWRRSSAGHPRTVCAPRWCLTPTRSPAWAVSSRLTHSGLMVRARQPAPGGRVRQRRDPDLRADGDSAPARSPCGPALGCQPPARIVAPAVRRVVRPLRRPRRRSGMRPRAAPRSAGCRSGRRRHSGDVELLGRLHPHRAPASSALRRARPDGDRERHHGPRPRASGRRAGRCRSDLRQASASGSGGLRTRPHVDDAHRRSGGRGIGGVPDGGQPGRVSDPRLLPRATIPIPSSFSLRASHSTGSSPRDRWTR